MSNTYKVTLTEEQMRVTQKCLEMYMRLLLGQPWMLAEELTFEQAKYSEDEIIREKQFSDCLHKRDSIYEILKAIFRIVYQNGYGTPTEKTDDCMIAECLWDGFRFARGQSRWDSPFQIGSEPSPKIEVTEDEMS